MLTLCTSSADEVAQKPGQCKQLTSCCCFHTGVALPTGLFVPSILCGAAYGRLVGVFVADLRPAIGSQSSIDEGTYALLGAASFLGKRSK
jgi:H+/Cl- antiporter ClcA